MGEGEPRSDERGLNPPRRRPEPEIRLRKGRITALLAVLAGLVALVVLLVALLSGGERPVAATPKPTVTLRVAFGGDVMTEGSAGRVLTEGLGSAGRVLRRADVAVVNVETAIAADRTGLTPENKQFTFIAPPKLLSVLARSGVDAVTMANNHGMDFGRAGLEQTLAAATPQRPQMIGIGKNIAAALKPFRTVVKGRGVTVFGASDVLDSGFDWAATQTQSGVAIIKDPPQLAALRAAVRAARKEHPTDVIAVFLHAGAELVVCPSVRQRQLATELSADGADAVMMSHAHVLQPAEVQGRTAVAYGLGNFVFYAESPPANVTGVFVATFPAGGGAPSMRLRPATISGGLPVIDRGAAARSARANFKALGGGC